MFDPSRHVTIDPTVWDERAVRENIREIADDALAQFDAEKFWPGHKLDMVGDSVANLYFGAVGIIWALDYLKRQGAIAQERDFTPVLPLLIARCAEWLKRSPLPDYQRYASLLLGDFAALLLAARLAPDAATADRVYERATANDELPVLELMWGTPGSMLGLRRMHEMTGEARFEALYRKQAARLLADLEDGEDGALWTQELYGQRVRYLSPVHGFAGNMLALMQGWNWLTDAQRGVVQSAALKTLARQAVHSAQGVNWPAKVSQPEPPTLCQYCHGAPGIVTSFADAPFSTPEFEALLTGGGELTWAAGPLQKGAGLCHGTAGNGYAFLKLYKRTGNPIWLERARAFAMTATSQMRATRREYGSGRYSLWTGDIGAAVYLWDCITAEPHFPAIDVF